MRRRPWLAAAVLVAGAAAVTLTVVTRDGGDRLAALALTALGAGLGVAAAVALTRRRTAAASDQAPKSAAERVNDAAFALVVTAVWALLLALPGPWPGLLTGALLGACGQLVARP